MCIESLMELKMEQKNHRNHDKNKSVLSVQAIRKIGRKEDNKQQKI